MPAATQYRVPPNGPTDQEPYLTLFAIDHATEGAIDNDSGNTYLTVLGMLYRIDLATVDDLTERGWVESPAHDKLRITDAGRFWLGKFKKVNRLTR